MKRSFVIAMLVAGFVLVLDVRGEGGEQAAAAPAVQRAQELDGLHERLVEIMKELRTPGLAVAVVRDDKIIYLDALGVRDPEKNLPVTPDTMFYIASCTKTFIAMAVKSLAEEGKLDLDAPVRKYLPRFQIADPKLTETLTIRDLLSHAKGLNSGPIVWLDAYTGEITEDRYYHWLREAQATGSHEYTNVHFTLAGRVVEAVTGKSWKDFLEERIFAPAGMTRSTCYASKMYGDPDCGIPTIRENGGFAAAPVRKSDRVMHAAGGMGTSVRDLARWIRLNLGGGEIDGKRLLSRDGIAEMQILQAKGRSQPSRYVDHVREGHGLGWFVGTFRKERLLDHGGGYIGTNASISFMPDHNIGVAVVANASAARTMFVATEIYDRLLGRSGDDPLPKYKAAMERGLARNRRLGAALAKDPTVDGGLSLPPGEYVGRYENEDWGTVHIEHVDGKLCGRMGDLRLRFGSTGTDTFYLYYGTGSPDGGRFEISKDGKRVDAVRIKLTENPEKIRFARANQS